MEEFRFDENLYNKISMNCIIMNMNINSIQQEIDKINDYCISVANNQRDTVEEFQLQNIFFHKKIIEKQLLQFKDIKVMCFNKLYRDFYMLYLKITEYLFELDKNFMAIEDPKETYFSKYITKLNIIPVNDNDLSQIFKVNEIDDIYKNIILRLDDHKRYMKEIDFLSKEIKNNGRLKLFTQGMETQGKKLYSEISLYFKLLNTILNNNMAIAEKYSGYSSKIYNELLDIVIF